MLQKTLVIVCALIFVTAAFQFATSSARKDSAKENDSKSTSSITRQDLNSSTIKQVITKTSSVNEKSITPQVPLMSLSGQESFKSRNKVAPLSDYESPISISLEESVSSIPSLMARASGNDKEALLALARIGVKCSEVNTFNARYFTGRESSHDAARFEEQRKKDQLICKSFPTSIIENRISNLERAAMLGSKTALSEFMQVVNETIQNDTAWVWKNVNELPRIQAQATQFAEYAISQGIAEGYVQMYQAHAVNGVLPQDNLTAYAYLELLTLALQDDPSNLEKYMLVERKNSLLLKLSETEKQMLPQRIMDLGRQIRK